MIIIKAWYHFIALIQKNSTLPALWCEDENWQGNYMAQRFLCNEG
mgnify:CR=1 FL=1